MGRAYELVRLPMVHGYLLRLLLWGVWRGSGICRKDLGRQKYFIRILSSSVVKSLVFNISILVSIAHFSGNQFEQGHYAEA